MESNTLLSSWRTFARMRVNSQSVLQNNTINTAKMKDEILLANYNEPGKNQDARVVISRLLTTQYSSSYMGTTVM